MLSIITLNIWLTWDDLFENDFIIKHCTVNRFFFWITFLVLPKINSMVLINSHFWTSSSWHLHRLLVPYSSVHPMDLYDTLWLHSFKDVTNQRKPPTYPPCRLPRLYPEYIPDIFLWCPGSYFVKSDSQITVSNGHSARPHKEWLPPCGHNYPLAPSKRGGNC